MKKGLFGKKSLNIFTFVLYHFSVKKFIGDPEEKTDRIKTFGGEAETALEVETQQLKNNFSATMFKKLRKKDLNET